MIKPDRKLVVLPGDDKPRSVCQHCEHVDYNNPVTVVNLVAIFNDKAAPKPVEKILLVRRAIEPRVGYWDLPGGHQERGEPLQLTGLRETWEEALDQIPTLEDAEQHISVGALLGVYETPRFGRTAMVYAAELTTDETQPGPESLEAKLFAWEDIPWNELAFPLIEKVLKHWKANKDSDNFAPEQHVFTFPPGWKPPKP